MVTGAVVAGAVVAGDVEVCAVVAGIVAYLGPS